MKQTSLTLKGVLMVVIAFLASVISTSGFPKTNQGWSILGITVIGTMLIYIGQSVAIKATSTGSDLNWLDLLKGFIVVAGTAISNWVGSIIVDKPIDWNAFWSLLLTVFIGYIAKNFMSNQGTTPTP